MIKCQHCGCQNPLGRIFCANCRAKLDLKGHAYSGRISAGSLRRVIRSLVLASLSAMFVILIGLMLWPADFASSDIDSDAFAQAARKINSLLSAPTIGREVFSEREINAYMAVVVARSKGSVSHGRVTASINDVSVSLGADFMVVKAVRTLGPIVVGPLQLGPVRSTFELVGNPVVDEHSFRFHVKRGRVGRLPLPRLLCLPLLSEMESFFAGRKKERVFLDKTGDIDIVKEMLVISMRKR